MESDVPSEVADLFCAKSTQISNVIAWVDIYGLEETTNTNEMKIQSKRIQLKWDVCEFKINVPREIDF